MNCEFFESTFQEGNLQFAETNKINRILIHINFENDKDSGSGILLL